MTLPAFSKLEFVDDSQLALIDGGFLGSMAFKMGEDAGVNAVKNGFSLKKYFQEAAQAPS